MPRTKVVFFREASGEVPILDWLDAIPKKARAKCIARLERLSQLGHELRQPEADLLRDGIYELRVRLLNQNYRMLYFFYGRVAAVVSHGLLKETLVPPKEINLAASRKQAFEANPKGHTYEAEIGDE